MRDLFSTLYYGLASTNNFTMVKGKCQFPVCQQKFFSGLEGVMSRNLKTTTSHLQINSFNEAISQWPWPGGSKVFGCTGLYWAVLGCTGLY